MKFNIIRNSILSAIFGGMLGLGACTDLSEQVFSAMPGDGSYEMSESDIQSMYGTIYDRMRDFYSGWEGYIDLSEESCDIIMTPYRCESAGWGAQYVAMHKHDFYTSMNHLYRTWFSAYQGISTCNQLLDMEAISASETNAAELKTYRALFYYVLFDAFRNIPLETTLKVPDGYMPEQADPSDTFDFIVSELNDAKKHLTKEVEFGQINYYGACMILAKMYLNHNAWFNTEENSYYEKAIDEVNEIINDGKYQLANTYLEPFGADTQSREVIYAILFDNVYAGNGTNFYSKWFLSGSQPIFGVTRDAWNGSAAVPQFIATYDKDDTRKTDTWKWGPQKSLKGEQIYVDGKELNYTVDVHAIDRPGAFSMEGARLCKYEIVAGDITVSNDDVPFFRLTDAYFIKAECLLRLGSYKGETEQDAADIVTMIRRRAFKNNPEKAVRTVEQLKGASCYDYGLREIQGDLDDNKNLINIMNTETHEGGDDIILGGLLDDLAWEFVYEHHRRQDLIRFKMKNGMNVYNGKSWFGKKSETDPNDLHKNIFPILQDNLSANPKLNQNPGYASTTGTK